jgi:hypothetical protein
MNHEERDASVQARHHRLPLAMMMAVVVAACLTLVPAAGAARAWYYDSVTPTWTATTNGVGTSSDAANAVTCTSNGIVYVTGHRGVAGNINMTLTKMVGGVKQWTKDYDSPYHHDDVGRAVATGPGGVVYTAGTSLNASGTADDMLLVKWSSSGKVLWARRYNGPAHGDDQADFVGVDKYGNVTVAGPSIGTYVYDWAVVSRTPAGTLRWTWRYSGAGHSWDFPGDLIVTSEGSMYVTGSVTASGGVTGSLTARLSKAGKKIWTNLYKGPLGTGSSANGMAIRPGGGVYVAGWALTAAGGQDAMVLRYTASGTRAMFAMETNGSTGTTAQWYNDVAVTLGGHVVAVGATNQSPAQGEDAFIADYTTSGAHSFGGVMAQDSLYGSNLQSFSKIVADRFGGYYALGVCYTTATTADIYVYKGNQTGGAGFWQCEWGNTFTAGHSGYNLPGGIAVYNTTAYVVGRCATATTGDDQVILGFAY